MEMKKKTGTRTHLSAQHTKSLPFHSESQGTGAKDNSLVAVFFVKNGVAPVNKNSTYKRLVLFKLNLHTKAAHA